MFSAAKAFEVGDFFSVSNSFKQQFGHVLLLDQLAHGVLTQLHQVFAELLQLVAFAFEIGFTGAVAGDSGLLIVSQDATASWTVSSTAVVLSGDLADIASITSSTGLGSIGWFFDGSVYTLYISDVT